VVTVGPKYIVVIEETQDTATARGVYWTDAALNARLKAKGHTKRIADKNTVDATGKPPADLAPYIARANGSGKGLPQLFIVDAGGASTGEMIFQGDLPATPAALLELLTKVGG